MSCDNPDPVCPCERCLERRAERAILHWCRNIHRGELGPRFASQPVMRTRLADGTPCAVIDLGQSELKPGARESGNTRDKRHAEGRTWRECATQLQQKGAKLIDY